MVSINFTHSVGVLGHLLGQRGQPKHRICWRHVDPDFLCMLITPEMIGSKVGELQRASQPTFSFGRCASASGGAMQGGDRDRDRGRFGDWGGLSPGHPHTAGRETGCDAATRAEARS